MTSDLAMLAADPTALEVYDDPGEQIVLACQRANAWLKAGIDVRIETIVETKAQAAALAAFAIQKQLGKDAELAALEVQRRAERGVGLAIRAGQEAGEIKRLGDHGPARGDYLRGGKVVHVPPPVRDENRSSPADIVPGAQERIDSYRFADTDDDQFERAMDAAKAERNLSRANVVRKVKGEAPKPIGRPEALRGTHHLNSNRIVEQTVLAYEAADLGSLAGEVKWDQLDTDRLAEWVSSLRESRTALSRLITRLEREQTHD